MSNILCCLPQLVLLSLVIAISGCQNQDDDTKQTATGRTSGQPPQIETETESIAVITDTKDSDRWRFITPQGGFNYIINNNQMAFCVSILLISPIIPVATC